jgi:hypothetical protein
MSTMEQQAAARALYPAKAAAGGARQALAQAEGALETIGARFALGEVDEMAVEAAEHRVDAATRAVRRAEATVRGLEERAPTY